MSASDPDRPVWFKPPRNIVITLTCGHDIRVQLQPFRESATFTCDRNLGCGYALGWKRWYKEGTNYMKTNSRYTDQ